MARHDRPLHASRPAPCRAWDALQALARDLDQGLQQLEFDEVTHDDRITYVTCVTDAHVRRAWRAGAAGLAASLRRLGDRRLARLARARPGSDGCPAC
jgi:hypothetical protein